MILFRIFCVAFTLLCILATAASEETLKPNLTSNSISIEEQLSSTETELKQLKSTVLQLITSLLEISRDVKHNMQDSTKQRVKRATLDPDKLLAQLTPESLQRLNGKDGSDGAPGAPGKDGVDGPPGKDGQTGPAGAAGRNGRDGVPGANGEPGHPGLSGLPGMRGNKGEIGLKGELGPVGAKGQRGATGQKGQTGSKGGLGQRGHLGVKGPKGNIGSAGGVYTRWGKTTCRSGTERLYTGFVAGSKYTDTGGGVNYQCLPSSGAQYNAGYKGGRYTPIGGAEYQTMLSSSSGFLTTVHDHNVPCAKCYTRTRSAVTMLPARTSCPAGWTEEYEGYLMTSDRINAHPTTYECVDASTETIKGSAANTNGALFVFVKPICSGDGMIHHCGGSGGYVSNKQLACVVCSK